MHSMKWRRGRRDNVRNGSDKDINTCAESGHRPHSIKGGTEARLGVWSGLFHRAALDFNHLDFAQNAINQTRPTGEQWSSKPDADGQVTVWNARSTTEALRRAEYICTAVAVLIEVYSITATTNHRRQPAMHIIANNTAIKLYTSNSGGDVFLTSILDLNEKPVIICVAVKQLEI